MRVPRSDINHPQNQIAVFSFTGSPVSLFIGESHDHGEDEGRGLAQLVRLGFWSQFIALFMRQNDDQPSNLAVPGYHQTDPDSPHNFPCSFPSWTFFSCRFHWSMLVAASPRNLLVLLCLHLRCLPSGPIGSDVFPGWAHGALHHFQDDDQGWQWMASGNGNYTFNPTGGMDHFTQHPWVFTWKFVSRTHGTSLPPPWPEHNHRLPLDWHPITLWSFNSLLWKTANK